VSIGDAGSPRDPAARRLVGLAPQQIALYADLTARENLVFLARIHEVPEPSRRADALLDMVGLLPRARDRVGTFSGGMQRRLNLAAALVHEPPLLLLDEPTAGVDPQSRSAILDVVQGLAERGHAVLYTTHYMDEAQRICSRVAIVDHGRVLETGTVESLRAAHGGDLEAAFLALTGRSLRD
jgi:ABC-2 type transport system ATP-binding protein